MIFLKTIFLLILFFTAQNASAAINLINSDNWLTGCAPSSVTNIIEFSASTPYGIQAQTVPIKLSTNSFYELTIVYCTPTAPAATFFFIDLYKFGKWDAVEHDFIIPINSLHGIWKTNKFIFNTRNIPDTAYVRLYGKNINKMKVRFFSFKKTELQKNPIPKHVCDVSNYWDFKNSLTICTNSLRLNATESSIQYMSKGLLTMVAGQFYRLSITARSIGKPNFLNKLTIQLYRHGLYNRKFLLHGSEFGNKYKTYSFIIPSNNIPNYVTLRIFGKLFSDIDISEIVIEPIPKWRYILSKWKILNDNENYRQLIFIIFPVTLLLAIFIYYLFSLSHIKLLKFYIIIPIAFLVLSIGLGAYGNWISLVIVKQLIIALAITFISGWWLGYLILPTKWKQFACLAACPLGFIISKTTLLLLSLLYGVPFNITVIILFCVAIITLLYSQRKKQFTILAQKCKKDIK